MKLVYSSAPADDPFREQLSAHLYSLVQQGMLSEWHEHLIPADADAAQERHRAWRAADILLLLLSADYFVSDVYDHQEMQQALERHRSGEVLVIPILIRPYDWQATEVGHLQCLPRGGIPVTSWENHDAALLSIAQELRQRITARQFPPAPLSSVQRTNRQRLLKRVRTLWIEGLLEQSLLHATWVDLHLQKQPHGLENPWRLMVQELDRGPRPLPPGTSIIQVFDEADEELLILGEPGSGKTTLLLYLARTLLDRAEADERRRIPVIFNLSSWARQRLPLDQWLLEELKIRYQVPQQIGRAWVEANQIFPLLDGLDEVAEPVREACVQAITSYAQREQDRIPFIMCCHIEEYQALSVQIPLQYTVMLLPFSDEQIEVYLSSVSGRLDTLRQVLREDKELFELAHRPLMLSIFTLAYHGEASVDLPATTTGDAYPRALFQQYIKHMLTRRTQLHLGTEKQFRRWLTSFATQLHRQQQTIFAVEELQPAWLPERYRSRYRWGMILAYGLTFGLLFGPVFGVAFGSAYGLLFHTLDRLVFGTAFELVLGIVGGVMGGLIFGLAFGLVGGRTGFAAFLQHFVLRFFLWRLGLLPWNLVAFLDEATERLLLRKVGGSYIFVHRLLRDVLATQNDEV